MLRGCRIATVVPARNEERLVGDAIASVPAFVDDVVLVDDGSTDATVERALALGDVRVRVLAHPRSRGVGAAIATGCADAFARGADVVVVMAGDAQMDPADLPALLGPVLEGRADYVKGNRLRHPGARKLMPVQRYVGNHVFSALTRVALGLDGLGDSQCGYTAMHRGVGTRIDWSRLWPGYGYPNDLLAHLVSLGARVAEVVVRPVYAGERSGVRVRHALVTVPFVLARAFATRVRTTSRLAPPDAPVVAARARAAESRRIDPVDVVAMSPAE